jgi:outer membrane receptor protein involved in Fe transport
MKLPPHTPVDRAKQLLAIGLAALLTSASAYGQTDSDSVRRLQEENAALRKRLAALEGQVQPATPAVQPARAAAPAAAQPAATASAPADKELVVLSPFVVKSDKDYGYLKTNAATATRIGMEIQNVPMNISVMSRDFLDDTGVSTITDILRYTSSGSPDSRYAMRIPGNSATPQGNFTLRGFTVNSLLRNGVFRYNSYNLDNVERVEIVKGPAAVFFGQGYPGGVINYITKKPIFEKNFTSISFAVDDNGGRKVIVDQNTMMSEKAAIRVVGAWTDQDGHRTAEFRKNFNITPTLTLNPLKSGKLRINMELEYLKESYNQNDYAWIYPQGWFDAYKNPSAALIAASGVADATAYRTRIFNSVGNWAADMRKAANDPTLPVYTTISPSGFYTDKSGNRVEDKAFNFTNSGAYTSNEVKTFQTTVDLSPFNWVDARYTYTKDNSTYDGIQGLNAPNADGITFNAASGGGGSGYYRRIEDHQLDVILKGDFFHVKNKLLIGGVYSRPFQQYMASAGAVYYSVPGYNYPTPPVNNLPNGAVASNSQVPVNQVLRDRNGNILTAPQVYSLWDPAYQVNPPTSKIYNIQRNLLDGYKSKNEAFYLNWQANMLKDDKLTVLGGYRRETSKGYGQSLVANDPWFITPENAYLDTTTYPENVYNFSKSYAGDPEGFRTLSGDSWMGGLSYAITKEISVYATVSKTFKINTGLAGGFDELAFDTLAQAALTNGGGSFAYRGQTITSVAQARAAIVAAGATTHLNNEDGKNFEVGLKTSLWNGKLVSTFSLFRGIRQNQKLDDAQAQANASEPFNYSTTMFAVGSPYYNVRNFRWRAVGVKNQITGADFDVTYTPLRNYQIVVNGAWMWQAETIDNPTYFHKGTAKYTAATAANQALYDLYYNNRIENVPEFRLNVFNKYTFTNQAVRGLSVALGGRYSSATIVSRSLDWNPDRGGLTVGNYVVFDANIAYPWELFGYKLNTSLGINNLTDKVYYEGNVSAADSRSWTLRTTVNF